MRKIIISAVALSLLAAAAHAQPAAAPAAPAAAPAASGKLTVDKTLISDLIKVPAAKAALEKTLPEIAQFYDQIGSMTLKDVQPLSEGAIDDAKLAALQADFDKIK
jgi:hypothetical protein